MPRSSIDKSSAATPVSPASNQPNSADFLPKYEETLNHNLRNFGDPEAQHGNRMQEPDLKFGLTKKRRAIVVGSLIALVLIVGAVMAGLLTAKVASAKQQVSTFPNSAITTTIIAKATLQSPLSTRATILHTQATTTALAESKSQPTTTVAGPSVILATTLITTTVAPPSSKLVTSFVTVTAKPQTTQTQDSLPLIITTAFWSKDSPDASFKIYTSRTTINGKSQSTFFSYSPTSTPTSTPASTRTSTSTSTTSSVLAANKTIIASVLSDLQAHATPSSTSSQTPPPPPPITTIPSMIISTPVPAINTEAYVHEIGREGSMAYPARSAFSRWLASKGTHIGLPTAFVLGRVEIM
ncbi:hypothetical protein LTR97_002073 [Elasticomyces elasticus]|uniref:Uncharacterized protein n=1 Tax=Elasticomyces elasticus TaxID=574655 RepID=A0AAN7WAB4_9PEZI|nr:hypothetical protein LTR97_002073 [Elasticomyces elasticus]